MNKKKYLFVGNEEDMKELKLYCIKEGKSMSEVIRDLIHKFLIKKKK